MRICLIAALVFDRMAIHISGCVRIFCALSIVALAIAALGGGAPGGFWSAVAFLACIYVFTSKEAMARQPLVILLSLNLVFYYGVRLWDYYVFDPRLLQSFFPLGQAIETDAGAQVMGFALVATIAMYLGLWASRLPAAEAPADARAIDRPPFQLQFDRTTFLVLFVLLNAIIVVLTSAGAERLRFASMFVKAIPVLISGDVLLFFAIILHGRRSERGTIYLWIVLCLYFLIRIAERSRSGVVDAATILLAWAAIPGNWNGAIGLSVKNLLIGLAVASLAVPSFFYVMVLRAGDYGGVGGIANEIAFLGTVGDIGRILLFVYESIAYRVGTNLDALYFVFSSSFDHFYADRHVNLYTAMMNVLQRELHTVLSLTFTFPEYEFAHLVGNTGYLVDGNLIYTGYPWGIFAYCYQLFGWWWTPPVLFTMFFLFGRSYRALMQRRPGLHRDALMAVTAYAMEMLLILFGIDNLVQRLERTTISYFFLVMLFRVLSGLRPAPIRVG